MDTVLFKLLLVTLLLVDKAVFTTTNTSIGNLQMPCDNLYDYGCKLLPKGVAKSKDSRRRRQSDTTTRVFKIPASIEHKTSIPSRSRAKYKVLSSLNAPTLHQTPLSLINHQMWQPRSRSTRNLLRCIENGVFDDNAVWVTGPTVTWKDVIALLILTCIVFCLLGVPIVRSVLKVAPNCVAILLAMVMLGYEIVGRKIRSKLQRWFLCEEDLRLPFHTDDGAGTMARYYIPPAMNQYIDELIDSRLRGADIDRE